MKPVKPKIVSKDNSSPSAKEQIKLTKYGNVELTPLAKKLMVFAKEDKSVLLYGDYAGDLSVFISQFHKVLHDTEPFFEYVGKKKMPISFSPSEYLTREMVKAISDRDHERIYELLRDFECTNNTHLEFDCNPYDGKTVFKVLTRDNHFTQEEFIDNMSFVTKKFRKHEIYLYWESICTDIMANKDNFCEAFSNATSYRSQPLLERKGTLFVNNLTCNGTEDKRWFKALGKEIKKCKYSEGEWHVFYTKRDGWLVVAIDDLDDFPQIFVDQFEQVPLDDSEAKQQNKEINKEGVVVGPDAKVEEAKDKTKGKLIDKIPSGTKWTEIEMSLVDKEYKTLDISIRGGKSFTVNPREIGLESNHTHKPLKAWWVLMAFAQSENGEIPSTGEALRDFAVSNYKMVPKEGKALFDHIDKLRKALSINFGISDDPVPHSADKEAYETLFRIKDTSYTEEHKKSSQNIEGAKCNECGEVIKKLDHNNLDEEGNYICDKCKGASYDRLSKGGTYGEYPGEDE
jgi:hypothetical protein